MRHKQNTVLPKSQDNNRSGDWPSVNLSDHRAAHASLLLVRTFQGSVLLLLLKPLPLVVFPRKLHKVKCCAKCRLWGHDVRGRKCASSFLPPETVSYGGGRSRWERDDDGGRETDGSPTEPSSWTPYQFGQIEVYKSGGDQKEKGLQLQLDFRIRFILHTV